MKKLELSDFKGLSAPLVEDAIELLTNLDERLLVLLEKELAAGNKIARVSKGWPSKDGLLVQMSGKVKLDVNLPEGVQYEFRNDPHYWIHEFTTYNGLNQANHDMLICNDKSLP